MIDLLTNITESEIRANIDMLAKDYLNKCNRKVCRTCPSDIQYMIISLQNYYDMGKFSFKKNSAQYKNRKGDKVTISNDTMTDRTAIEFLKTNPDRIDLFVKFPENWKVLIEETEEEKTIRLAIEAEIAAAENGKEEGKDQGDDKEKLRTDLMKLKLRELRKKYPSIHAVRKADFVEQALNL